MGLNFSHTDMHWSYSCFHEFRRKLAAEIGIDLDDMDGFEGTLSWDDLKDISFLCLTTRTAKACSLLRSAAG